MKELPSWAPDWTRTEESSLIPATYDQWSGRERFSADGARAESSNLRCSSPTNAPPVRQLQLQGIRIGSFVKTSDECKVGNNIFSFDPWQELARSAGKINTRVDKS
jgi:hypothetical protein